MSDCSEVWEAALAELRLQMTKATFDTWVANTRVVGCEGETYVIGVQNGFARDWLEQRLKPVIERTLAGLVGSSVTVEFEVVPGSPVPVLRQTVTEADLQQEEMEIDGVRVLTYNEIVEPDRVFVGAQYFREEWLPLLGRTTWLLILELRQRCYYDRREKNLQKRKKKSRDTCKVTLAELGAAVGVSVSTVRRALFPEDPEAAVLVGEFIIEVATVRRYSSRQGREVNETTMWKIRLDEPLTPADRKKCSTFQNDM